MTKEELVASAPPVADPDAIAWSIVVLARAIEELQTEIRLTLDTQTVNESTMIDALAHLRSDVTDLKLQAAHGLRGAVFGYPITLTPSP